jgi:hypothetical protein
MCVTTIARFFYDGFFSGLLKDFHWDVIMFDEASMIMLAQMIYVLYQQIHCRFIICGDPFQIQPLVIAELWKARVGWVGAKRHHFSININPHHCSERVNKKRWVSLSLYPPDNLTHATLAETILVVSVF